jgi:hypothetical protein
MGVAAPGQLPPQLDRVAFELGEGQVSDVLEHPEGFTILKCLRILPERTMPLEEARQKLRQHLESQARERAWDEASAAALGRWPLKREMPPEAILSAEPSRVVARFGDRAVTREDLGRWLGGQPGHPAAESLGDDVLRTLLENQARQHAAARRAEELGLKQDPEVTTRIAWERLRALSTEELRRRVREAFVEPREEELRARFESSREGRIQPARFRVSVLRFRCEAQPLTACRPQAERVMARLRAGVLGFEDAARDLSSLPSSAQGGDLGWRTSRDLAALGTVVLPTLKELAVGELSPLLLQDNALWAVKLTGREDGRPQTFEEAKLSLQREVGNEQVQALQKRIQDELLAGLDLKVAAPWPG